MAKLTEIYTSPTGRLGRLNFFLYSLVLGVISAIINILARGMELAAEPNSDISGGMIIVLLLVLIVAVIITYFGIILSIKRFHDLNKSGWWCLLFLIPVVGFIVWLVLLFVPGTTGSNQFGEQPA